MSSGQAVKWPTSSEESEAANPARTHPPAPPDTRRLRLSQLKACSPSAPVSSAGWGGLALPFPIHPQRASHCDAADADTEPDAAFHESDDGKQTIGERVESGK